MNSIRDVAFSKNRMRSIVGCWCPWSNHITALEAPWTLRVAVKGAVGRFLSHCGGDPTNSREAIRSLFKLHRILPANPGRACLGCSQLRLTLWLSWFNHSRVASGLICRESIKFCTLRFLKTSMDRTMRVLLTATVRSQSSCSAHAQ